MSNICAVRVVVVCSTRAEQGCAEFAVVSGVFVYMGVTAGSVREYVFYVFFQISKKHDFLRFFEMTYQKVVKSL